MHTLNSSNYFEMFGLMPRFTIDLNSLEISFRQLQSQLHPDRHASQSEAEQRMALQLSTSVNDGYRTLRNPASRALCLLSLAGKAESTLNLSPAFLMAQMEWREAIAEACAANDVPALQALTRRLKHKITLQEQALAQALDETEDFDSAAIRVNELRFYEKLRTEIADALDRIEV